jgi:hypothetical protein
MKILLRDSRKRLYFRHGRVWTSKPELAFEFQQAQELFQFVARRQLSGVEAVLILENPRRLEIVALESVESPKSISQAA